MRETPGLPHSKGPGSAGRLRQGSSGAGPGLPGRPSGDRGRPLHVPLGDGCPGAFCPHAVCTRLSEERRGPRRLTTRGSLRVSGDGTPLSCLFWLTRCRRVAGPPGPPSPSPSPVPGLQVPWKVAADPHSPLSTEVQRVRLAALKRRTVPSFASDDARASGHGPAGGSGSWGETVSRPPEARLGRQLIGASGH